MARTSSILDSSGKPMVVKTGGKGPREELIDAFAAVNGGRMRANYDAARDTDEYRRHWANADHFDADSANSKPVRHKLMRRSRYEQGSNGYYDGILETHVNMAIGVGPTLRMLTKDRDFNRMVEREFFEWSQKVMFNRKLWCMGHARYMDGESFGILVTNPALLADGGAGLRGIALDVVLIEAEQCQTPLLPFGEVGYIDGIKFDEFNNVEHYDVLPAHPGRTNTLVNLLKPNKVEPTNMLHWFKLKRPAAHRGIPALTSTLNVGASSRRLREAVLGAAETAADFSLLLQTKGMPDTFEGVRSMSSFEIFKRMMVVMPDGYEGMQLKGEHPNMTYGEFNRSNIGELGRPIGSPYNLSACDSSQYSFASSKMDMIAYWMTIGVERRDCNDLVLDPLFREWFSEWSLSGIRQTGPPAHQWDWPAKPIIDSVAESQAQDTKLHNSTVSLRQAFTDQGQDYEDELLVQTEDTFGEATPGNIEKQRKINVLKNTPKEALPFVAQLLGVESPAPQPQPQSAPQPQPQGAAA